MAYAKELADPWGLLLAVSAALVAVAIDLPAGAVVAVGVAVLCGRAAIMLWTRANSEPEVEIVPEQVWLDRAVTAEADFHAASTALVSDSLSDWLADMAGGIEDAVNTLHALAARADEHPEVLAHLEYGALALEDLVSRIENLASADADVLADLADYLDVIRRTVAETEETTRPTVG
ncbi:hypothetical protein [Actinokineospora iranica]|uniref:Uncharacterized protein n=1 Tax=Actinokineospora iranica TaxID=1271860 RepID=A0A1G6PCE4_9PSEU|nr:hypothetical protein [Actinokineospora iranica]SDC76985.1 hypothetical protein SAMN05216174_104194 [Actinokineospora iranica]